MIRKILENINELELKPARGFKGGGDVVTASDVKAYLTSVGWPSHEDFQGEGTGDNAIVFKHPEKSGVGIDVEVEFPETDVIEQVVMDAGNDEFTKVQAGDPDMMKKVREWVGKAMWKPDDEDFHFPGWHCEETGGGCKALGVYYESGGYVWLTTAGGGDVPDPDEETIVGVYTAGDDDPSYWAVMPYDELVELAPKLRDAGSWIKALTILKDTDHEVHLS